MILVAGFTSNLRSVELDSFFDRSIDWEKIKKHCKSFVAIHSDNDPFVSIHYGALFKEKLNADVVIEHDKKHFSGDDNITKLPSVLRILLRLSSKQRSC